MDDDVAIHMSDTSRDELCTNCAKLDLETMFETETEEKDIGILDLYTNPVCPFCALIWRSIRMHWGQVNPLSSTSTRPRLFIQSKEWCSFTYNFKRYHEYRILLAISQQPPKFELKRRKLITDRTDRFILAEIELTSGTLGNNNKLPSRRRRIESTLDYALLNSWLMICKGQSHQHYPESDSDLFTSGFRLIDVIEARLVEIFEPCEYFALSYVWGGMDPFTLQTTKHNIDHLRKPQSLNTSTSAVGKRVPRTIRDAMELCKAVGQRYLWVDCLCIVQDDVSEKQRLIHGMGHVYEDASLTICAVSGRDADVGLAGVSTRESLLYEQHHRIPTNGSTLSVTIGRISLIEQIRKSHWNTRGWTCQEQVLSARCLYLTPDESFFECAFLEFREGYVQPHEKVGIQDLDVNWRRSNAPWWELETTSDQDFVVPSLTGRDGRLKFQPHYTSIVSNYTRRNLTHPEDILNAFTGIYQKFTNGELSVFATHGMPLKLISSSLLWFFARSDASITKHCDETRALPQPSWSWASYQEPVDFVCIFGSSFPTPLRFDYHVPGACCFIDKWYLTFHDGPVLTTFTEIENKWQERAKKDILFLTPDALFLTPSVFLSFLPIRPEARSSATVPGTLEFTAPCVTLAQNFRVYADPELSDRYRYFSLPESTEELCLISLDTDNQQFTDIVVIRFDGTYVGLCLETIGGISTRVGVAVFTSCEQSWLDALKSGSMSINWRHVQLR